MDFRADSRIEFFPQQPVMRRQQNGKGQEQSDCGETESLPDHSGQKIASVVMRERVAGHQGLSVLWAGAYFFMRLQIGVNFSGRIPIRSE
jgi:hypothetical protein